MSKDQTKHCFQLGYKGFGAGINRPMDCAEWRKQLEGLKVEDESGAQAWLDGWHKAQDEDLRKNFPDMYEPVKSVKTLTTTRGDKAEYNRTTCALIGPSGKVAAAYSKQELILLRDMIDCVISEMD